jgi:hypothetical protein
VPVVLTAVVDPDVPISCEPGTPGIAYVPGAAPSAPVFAELFPVDPAGLVFGGATAPCFGIWHGIDPARRARLSAQVRVLRWQGPQDLIVELLPAGAAERIVIARLPAPTTLAAAADEIARAVRGADRALDRWMRSRRLDADDGLRLPVVRAIVPAIGDRGAARIELGVDGPAEPVPERVTLGRGDAYRRLIAVGGPFLLWVGTRASAPPILAAWIVEV